MARPPPRPGLVVAPLTPERFPDLEWLFGPHGACGGCWCMWWRLRGPAFRSGLGEGNRAALRRYVEGGVVPGLLAYDGTSPVGWVAVEPRGSYPRLARSRNLAPVDGEPVWSITCFFVDRAYRRRGVTRLLIEAAAAHARAAGARLLEAYPREPEERTAAAAIYTGVSSTFRRLGFAEVARRAPSRPVLRLELDLAGRPVKLGPPDPRLAPALASSPRARPARARAPGRSRPGSSPRRGSSSRSGR